MSQPCTRYWSSRGGGSVLQRFLGKILLVRLPATFRSEGRENLSDLLQPTLTELVKRSAGFRVIAELRYRGWRFDEIPWEIHLIGDNTAYETAAEAYKANRYDFVQSDK